MKLIRDRIKASQYCQKSYVDLKRRLEEFEVRDRVFLRVSVMQGVVYFGPQEKLSPRILLLMRY